MLHSLTFHSALKPSLRRASRLRGAGIAAVAALGALMLAEGAHAQQAAVPVSPDAVTLPAGINLGLTSFYDGFGRTDGGFVFIDYVRYENLDQITGSDGRSSPAFVSPRIDVAVDALQGIWISPIHPYGGGLGIDVVQPYINFDSHFDAPGVILHDNGSGAGDLTFGPLYQAKPIISGGRPVFSWRAELDFIAPTGAFDTTKDVNQSSGFWSFNPYIAMTALPTPNLELSARFWYLYNFQTDKAPNPPPVPGFTFRNGQAGQAAWVNFAASYSLSKTISVGINGYYLKQLTDDRVNGVALAGTIKKELYLGPGAHITLDPHNLLNLNLYLPVETSGLATGTTLNAQYIHPF